MRIYDLPKNEQESIKNAFEENYPTQLPKFTRMGKVEKRGQKVTIEIRDALTSHKLGEATFLKRGDGYILQSYQ